MVAAVGLDTALGPTAQAAPFGLLLPGPCRPPVPKPP